MRRSVVACLHRVVSPLCLRRRFAALVLDTSSVAKGPVQVQRFVDDVSLAIADKVRARAQCTLTRSFSAAACV